MGTMTNSQRLAEARRRREEEEGKNSSSFSGSYRNSEKIEKRRYEREIGLDTFESDLQSVGDTINTIYSGWQTQETMSNTRSTIESMQSRINTYQNYQKKYGGNDVSDLASGYQSVLDDWDKLSSAYANYQNADAYNNAVKKAKLDDQFNGLSYDEVQSKKKEYAKDSDEYKYLEEYINYTDLNDFDKALSSISEDSEYKEKLQTSRNKHALDNAFDSYKSYKDKDDFAEKSQYASTEVDSKWKKLTSQYSLGYGDLTYEYINNINGARDEISRKASIYGMDSKDFASEQEEKGYDKLNEDEVAVYNYIYATEGKDKAQEFLDAMEITLTKRVYDEATQRWEEIADSGAGASVALSALSVPANLMGGIYSFGSTVSDAVKGKEYNPYGYYKMPSNFATDTREYVSENIAESTEGMEVFGQNVPSFLYQTGMSTADSAVGLMMFDKALAPVMGMTAYQQKAKELKEAGASEEEVQRGAIASGTFEMAFEYISIDKLLKIKDADSFGKIVTESLKQAGVEGSEEMFTEIANIGWDTLSRQDSSEIMQKYQDYLDRGFTEEEAKQKIALDIVGQVGWAGVGGALSGGGMGSVVSVGNYSDLSATGNQIRSNDRVQEMIDLQDLMGIQGLTPEQSEAYKLYGEYAQKGVNADTISNAQLGNLYQTSLREANATVDSRKATQAQKTDANKRLESLDVIATAKPQNERTRQQRVASLNKGEVTEVTSTGNATTIEGIKIDDGNTIVLTSEGEVKAEDMTFSSKDAEILAYAEDMGETKGNLLVAQYDGKSDVESFVRSFEMAYAYGEIGMDSDSVLRNKGVLTEAQASEIYKTALTNKVNERQNAINAINVKHSKNVFVEGKFDDSIIDYEGNATGKVAWKDLTKTQRDAITFVKGFSQATGVNVTFIKSAVKDGKRVGKNGSYNPNTNTIEIDVYAGIIDATSVKDSIVPTLSHEMTHWMKAKSPSMYSKIQTHALETLAMDGKLTSEERIASEMNRMKKSHPDVEVTEEMAIDEIVARYCEDMLSNSNTARKLLNQMSKKEQNSFIAKVKETFNNLMEWVNELLSKYKSSSKEAEILREYKARLKEVSKMWDKMLTEAIQTNQSLQAEGITGEQVLKENEIQWADRVEEEFNMDATIEQTEGMIVVHNLSEEKLLKTLKLGGFPMPSIAVTKASVGFKGFGSISLLFRKDTIDPNLFRSNKVYSGDAWTPTYPSIEYKVNDKVKDKVRDKYYDLSNRLGYDELRPLYRYAENLEDTLNRDGGESAMLERLYEDTGIMQIYLQDTGKERVQPIEIETRTEITREEAEARKSFIEAIGEELLDEFEIPSGENGLTYRKEFLAKHKDEVESAYRKVLVEHYELTEEEAQSELNATKPMKLLSIVRDAYMYTKDKGISVQTKVDTEATNNAIREASADGYKEWIDSLFKGVQEKSGIRNNKDMFTSSGNRRSWDTLHYEETLENIIKSMKEQGEKGVGSFGGSIFGASTKDLESIGEIKEAGKRLRAVSQDEYAKMKNAFMDRFNRIADSLRMHEGYMALDGACELLVEAVAKNNTRSGIANYIKKEGKGWTNYSEQIVDDLIELVNDIRNMPVNYFEAKPMRVVGFDEIACAVIPDNSSEHLRKELSNLNIPMKEYKAGDEDARVDVVNSVEGIQFSDRDSNSTSIKEQLVNAEAMINSMNPVATVDENVAFNNKQEVVKWLLDKFKKYNYKITRHGFGEIILDKKRISNGLRYAKTNEEILAFSVVPDVLKKGIVIGEHTRHKGRDYDTVTFASPIIIDGVKWNVGVIVRIEDNNYYKVHRVILPRLSEESENKNRDTAERVGGVNENSGLSPTDNISIDSIAKNKNISNITFSDRDTSGRQLTEEQHEFYADSKIRDAEGRLKVMYHGSGASFTVFDKKKAKSSGYYGSGFYFTESETHAKQYGSNYEVYLNITNPMQEGTNNITKAQLKKFVQAVADNEDYGIENYGYGATANSVANSVLGKDDFGMILDINATCVGDMVEAIQLFNEVNGTTYDGIVVPTETVAFYANQIKKVDNLQPTENEDIRYSDRDSEYIDDWFDNLTAEEMMAILQDDFFFEDEVDDKKSNKPRYKGDTATKGKVAKFTTERIERLFREYGASDKTYAKAYVTSIHPRDFLSLTQTDEILEKWDKASKEGNDVTLYELDIDKLRDETQTPFLKVDTATGEVIGHEGRHRMRALLEAGVTSVPISVIDYNTKYSKKIEDRMKFTSQDFGYGAVNDGFRTEVRNLIPTNEIYRNEIISLYGGKGDIQFSDRDNVSIYDVMGETESLKKQNAILKADIESLKERLKLERQVTKGNTFDEKKLTAVAKHLRHIAKSDYSETSLVEGLREVYSYIVETPQLDWETLMSKSYDVARNVLNSSKGYKVTNDYFKSILWDIRRARITLNDEQIQEAKSVYGERYRDAFMGRIMLVKHGTALDQKWQEWSAMYPEIFDADVTDADQITALSDIYDSLKAGAEMYQAFNDEEGIRAFATEIYNQYWNVSTIRTTADKYEKQIKRINFEHRKAIGELREDYKKRVEDQKKADSIYYGRVISKIRQQRDTQVKEAKQLGKKRMDEYKDRLERNAKIKSITAKALTLNQWLTKNSKDEHIPEVMKAPVAYLLNAIDFSSKQLLGMRGGSNAGMATKRDISLSKALEQVHDMVQKINSAQIGEDEITEIYGTFADFPAGFADDIRDLSSIVNDVMRTVGDNAHVLNQMSLEELETLDRIITIIKATATKMNKFLAIRHAEGVANLSQQSINYMDSLGKGKTHEGILGKVDKLLDWGNALPYYTFKRFGEGGQKVYEALQNGWDTFAFHVKEIIDYTDSVYTSKEVKEWSETVKEFDILEPATDEEKASSDYEPKYQKVKMSVPQIMSLYCLQKREQAKSHLMGGGMRISDIETKKGIVTQSEGVILTHSEIDMIVESLTDRQRAVADELQKFMNTTCTDWGNEVSMLRFGFKAFGEENYFPIQSDKNNLAVNDETEQNNSLFRLLNMSFTKGTIKKANNRIVISDIFDVFAQHTSDMAKYNALALPVLDSFKWYNYKEKIKKGDTAFTTKSLKQSMENAFSKDAQNYFVTFLKDINGEQSAGRDVVGGGFFTNAKLASVGFNMRVVALQPTSYVRASAVIDNKYLAKAFIHKPKISMAVKHCGIALWKSLGFYDINIQNSVTDMIKGNQTLKDKIADASMKGAEIADKVTWGYLWNACELEVRDKRKDLRVGSEEFYEAIGKRLREVIYSTQVVDSTMTRSHMMRSKDGKDKMLTAFMSEPTLAYNMLQDCYFDWKLTERQTGSKQTAFKKHGKKMARVITAYTVTNMICALVESGFDIFRDDDDEMTPEDFIKLYLKNFASDMSILNKIPYAKEVVSMLQGYSSSRTDTQWMQYMTYTITGIGKLIAGEGNVYTTAKNAMRALSQMTGLPFYNVWRDATAFMDKTELLSADELEEIFNDTIGSIFPSLKSK